MSMSLSAAGSASPDATRSTKPPANLSTNARAVRSAIAEDPTMARTAFVVDRAMREKVRYLAGVGVSQDDIARIIGCAPKTLRKRFRDELDRGVAEANATMCGYLYAAAKAGNISAIIFWVKTRTWREGGMPQAPDIAAASTSPVVLLLPDNNRDPELTEALRKAQEKYFSQKKRR